MSGDWVYGDLIHGVGFKEGSLYILRNKTNLAYVKHCDPLDGVRVAPESIGQLLAKVKKDNGEVEEIFEGDLIVHGERVLKVMFISGNTSLVDKDEATLILLSFNDGKKKVGNIFDNPELLTN